MTSWFFVIRHRGSDTIAGGALVALEARYVATCFHQAPRLIRGFATRSAWNEIRHEFSVGLPTTPLPSTDALAAGLLAERAIDVQLLQCVEVEVDAPGRAVPCSMTSHVSSPC